jgi:hypothetical protein
MSQTSNATIQNLHTNMSKTTRVSQLMYYDSYEYEFGDGFYPQISKDTLDSELTINFALINNTWKQTNSNNINGLDGNCGEHLLQLLNQQLLNQKCDNKESSCKIIYNRNNKLIYPK